ncbi:unnamed protein product, partial [Iphiclides podalirius]
MKDNNRAYQRNFVNAHDKYVTAVLLARILRYGRTRLQPDLASKTSPDAGGASHWPRTTSMAYPIIMERHDATAFYGIVRTIKVIVPTATRLISQVGCACVAHGLIKREARVC